MISCVAKLSLHQNCWQWENLLRCGKSVYFSVYFYC